MKRKRIWMVLTAGLAATVLLGGIAAADSDPLTGTWHQRDAGTSNIFYFIDEPVGGVYPVLFYDDYTSTAVCGDNGAMVWSGFATETGLNTNEFAGTFGTYWCPDDGNGVEEDLLEIGLFDFTFTYDPYEDEIIGFIGGGPDGLCVAERQDGVDNPNEAAEEIAEGEYPPPDPDGSC